VRCAWVGRSSPLAVIVCGACGESCRPSLRLVYAPGPTSRRAISESVRIVAEIMTIKLPIVITVLVQTPSTPLRWHNGVE
jgi:hypothetical protein